MADAECLLNPVLEKVAKDEEYHNYKKEVTLIYSGGANYTSQLFNITLSAPGKDDLKLFAKVAVIGEKLRSLTTMQVFETEIMFYTTILSKYREYEQKYNFPKEDRLVLPKYFGGSTEYMKETLVLEELTAKEYQPFDRFKCFDWEYASKCVSVLARLHALSIRYEKDNPKLFEDVIAKLAIQFPMDEMKVFMERGVASAIGVTVDENKERLGKFIKENMSEESWINFYNPKRKVCLNHGDFRPSNVMHKRDENGNLEVVVVDYQVLQKGNPVTDLLYFLIGGSDEEFRDKHLRQYFDHYYEEFSKTLRSLEIDPDEVYTKTEFDSDVDEMLPFGVIVGMFTLPFITVDVENAPKLEDGIDFESFAMELSELFKTRFNGLVNSYNGNLEVVVVDYQVLQKGNPVTDLLYFLIGGSDEEFRDKHLRQYFDHYYEEFSKTLRSLEIDPDEVYTKTEFDSDVDEMLPFGVIVGMFTLPFITVDVENAPKLEDGIDFESFAMELSELFKTRFNGLVNSYVKMGIL